MMPEKGREGWFWDGLPDPTDSRTPAGRGCTVLIDWAIQHIAKHVAEADQPWHELLDPPVIARFAQWSMAATATIDEDSRRQFLLRLGEQINGSLHQPRALLCESRYVDWPRDRSSQPAWELVLPVGASLIVRLSGQKNYVRTCFFRSDVCDSLQSQRWADLCQKLVLEHTLAGSGRQPPPDFLRTVDHRHELPEERRAIHFVQPDEWGFDPDDDSVPCSYRFPGWRTRAPQAVRPRVLVRRHRLD